eukprot:3220508-Amphidinium_carterae.1
MATSAFFESEQKKLEEMSNSYDEHLQKPEKHAFADTLTIHITPQIPFDFSRKYFVPCRVCFVITQFLWGHLRINGVMRKIEWYAMIVLYAQLQACCTGCPCQNAK